jgi:protease I
MRRKDLGTAVMLAALAWPLSGLAAPVKDTRPRVLVVVAPVAYQESEWQAVSASLAPRARLTVVSTRPGEAQGMSGGRLPIAGTVDRVRPEGYDLVVVLGGAGAKTYLWFDPKVHALLQGARRARRPLAAIDVAPAALAAAGVLKGRAATVLPAPETLKLFERNGVSYRAQEVVVDRDLVTAASAAAAPAWAAALPHLLPRRTRAAVGSDELPEAPRAGPPPVRTPPGGR